MTGRGSLSGATVKKSEFYDVSIFRRERGLILTFWREWVAAVRKTAEYEMYSFRFGLLALSMWRKRK